MDKRVRSPNYPALSLPEAVEKVQMVYRAQHTHGAPREIVVKGMGYAGLNGASATAVSALTKYGLLERSGDELKVSSRAMCIIAPHSPEEKAQALREAAFSPPLFSELADKFPGRMPNEDVLKNYLIRKGFAPGALSSVISAYKETSEMVEQEAGDYDSAHSHPYQEPELQTAATQHTQQLRETYRPQVAVSIDEERQIGRYDFEGGLYVRISASNEIDTEEALEMAETIIRLKRQELQRKKRRESSESAQTDGWHENEDD
ncbi:hypothetical protein AMST5_02935 [freshwater sediment metagenome]|uniref:Uncharacterized protein n=1 Tax=freshwater sediment metagenome TaxID=556182 RepID=A0AA48M3P8_9ZZZZ